MAMVYVAHSRGLMDKARKHAEELREKGEICFLPGKRIKIYDDKGKCNDEIDILKQKCDAVKGCDRVDVFWDGCDPDVAAVIGMAIALNKKVKSCYLSPMSIRRFLWETVKNTERKNEVKGGESKTKDNLAGSPSSNRGK